MLLVSKIKEDLILETSKILNYLVCMCLIKGLYTRKKNIITIYKYFFYLKKSFSIKITQNGEIEEKEDDDEER